jgi:putative transposase
MTEFGVRRHDAAFDPSLHQSDWPHAPVHRLGEQGAYMVTAGTYLKRPLLHNPGRLDLAVNLLFQCAHEFDWLLQAWAVMSNHYHFVAMSPNAPGNLSAMLGKLHGAVARQLNSEDGAPGRKVMYQYWDSHITFERSYLARLNYVHQNPVHHGIVQRASEYCWCSAAWFERNANPAFVKTVYGFKTDQIRIKDDF